MDVYRTLDVIAEKESQTTNHASPSQSTHHTTFELLYATALNC